MKQTEERDSSESLDREKWIQAAIDEHQGPLVRYAHHFLKDLDRARDVVQETFFKLLQQDRSKIAGHLKPWLFHVCRNQAIDVCRKENRMNLADSKTLDQSQGRKVNGTHSLANDPAMIAESNEDATRVERLVGQLNDKQQEVIRLKFQDAMSYKQIAEVTGLTASNVGFILHSALKKLRQQVKAEFN